MKIIAADRYGHFDLIDPPTAEGDAAVLAVQRVSDAYRANQKVQVERHAERFATA